MRSLFRLLVTVLLLGTAMQQGWLQAATGFAIEHLGGPAAAQDPLPPLDGMALAKRLGDAVAALPDPWYSLALMIGGIIALVFVASVLGGLIRATLRLTGWLRDAFV
jgi:hypothetical protein